MRRLGMVVLLCFSGAVACDDLTPDRAPTGAERTTADRAPASGEPTATADRAPDGAAEATAEATPAVDPDVIQALDDMGAFLRSKQSMAVHSDAKTDEILENGQKIQFASTVDLQVRRPDRLRLAVDSDRRTREFIYDGDTLTVYGPRNGYYASVAAPDTIRELVDRASTRYGIEFPLADLFLWGTDESPAADLESAMYIGPAKVNGKLADHYALRQPGLDWQIWIQRGPEPLPLKMVLTTTTEPEQPQHEVELDWTLDPVLDDDKFNFVPPEGSHKIDLVPVGDESAS